MGQMKELLDKINCPEERSRLLDEIIELKKQLAKKNASIIKSIIKSFKTKEQRKWDKIFYYFDIHETVLYPDYNNTESEKFYPYAEEVLQYLSTREDIVMSLYTCSYPEEIKRYQKFFESKNIKFTYINKNPEVANTKYGYYEDKPYYNVLFEDKAGFDAENDWLEVKNYFKL